MTVKFVNNRELLAEIHRSKLTFCSYERPEHAHYDAIVSSTDEITAELIEQCRLKRAKPRGGPKVPVESIPPESIVIRVMTDEHLPMVSKTTVKTRKTVIAPHKTTFRAFKHYVRWPDGSIHEVLRSHWKGDFVTGEFSPDHGRITNRLGQMFLMMVDRYAQRGNWRGYSYVDEMRSNALMQLSQVGLQFDESKSDNPFSYYTQTMKRAFGRVLTLEKKQQSTRDDFLEIAGLNPSLSRQMAA